MKKLIIGIVFCTLKHYAACQNKADQLDELLSTYYKESKFNGSALVAMKGGILLNKGYGFKNVEANQVNDENTVYQIGSITKQFTAAIILRLQEQGKLSVNDKLNKYYSGFPNGDKITIAHLLTHTSGIYNYTNDEKFMAGEMTTPYEREKMFVLFKDKPLDFEPGTNWNYSNSGYLLLGYVIEKVTGKPYESVMRELVLQPLQMQQSGFDFTHLASEDKATGYMILTGEEKSIAPIMDSTISYSAGALYSTTGDLYKWERGITNAKILKKDSWNAALTPVKKKYGYGWIIDSMHGRLVQTHGGGIHGFNSQLLRIPDDDITIILLNNKNNGHLNEITKSLAAILLDKKYEMPKGRTQVTLADSVLQRHVGEYELTPAFEIEITLENNVLKAQATGQPGVSIYPQSENFFFYKVVDAQVEFVKGPDGKTEKMILHQNGQQINGKKVK